ncbi:hypothetical protein [Bacillus sp. RAR_GA_16]|uniref:hypothetical protein n=1 Tax=Bacillus sp. RAR_GA_16 TaxID=2876774 RepID=UPI001CCD57CE|nr:hypothetical protein [Bacillus sp. RAR_GA_16]MCA0172136.1 hypothetical protein [Bacillus sp. RAR_GA_16]
MSYYRQDILNYGEDVSDLENSPFETLRMLHDRTELHRVQEQFDFEDKVLLAYHDLKLIENAENIVQHISSVYDFNLSDTNEIPHEQWWWHLNKIAKGNMDFGIATDIGKVM